MQKYTTVIWDWNGTLLNDAWLGLEVMNNLLASRQLPVLTLDKYRYIFDFPVKDYYAKLFDFANEPFEVLGNEFIINYDKKHLECKLHKHALESLERFKSIGIKQYVLSARNHHQLEKEFAWFGINGYFESFSGLSDNYANGKTELGIRLIKKHKIEKDRTILIGDTVHDFEVANALEIDCVLVEGGHQSVERLKSCGVKVLKSLVDLDY